MRDYCISGVVQKKGCCKCLARGNAIFWVLQKMIILQDVFRVWQVPVIFMYSFAEVLRGLEDTDCFRTGDNGRTLNDLKKSRKNFFLNRLPLLSINLPFASSELSVKVAI